ncbi:O-antigen ligase [Candidatus Rickettsiella viridis]|uniref:O-antigen ligase n=1 Tax=Candidatus Rickettsiella viridis TaxID=676208 RepID=A0A2Z5UVP2_9COXI|nr:O-antigen ligase family protein [Candidatus Rickettsiella viridis]BBB15030.1 O-antigen ligase [Candidatus Rickettsiella viridis]
MSASTIATKISGLKNSFKHLSQIFVIIAAFALPLSTAVLEVFFIASVMCCILAGDWKKHAEVLRTNRMALMFLVFFALFIVCISYSVASWSEELYILSKYSKFLLGFFLFSVFSDEKTRYYAFFSFLCAATLTLLLSYLKFFGWDILHRFSGDSGVFKDHIFTGFLLAFTSYAYALLAFSNKKWRLVFTVLFLLASFNVLFINLGRSGYVVFFSLLLLLSWQKFSWKGFSVAVLLSIFLLGGTLLLPSNFKDRFFTVHKEIQQYDKGKEDTSTGLRLSFYKNSLQLFFKHPWIGTGTGSFAKAYASVAKENEWLTKNPHNEYLNIAVQFGLLGLIVLLALFISHWQQSFRLPWVAKNFAQAVVVSIAVGCLFNSWLLDVTQGTFYVLFTALLFSRASDNCLEFEQGIG